MDDLTAFANDPLPPKVISPSEVSRLVSMMTFDELLVLAAVVSRPLPQESPSVEQTTADNLRKRGSAVLTLTF